RTIIHVDMDAFYASVEQRDRPEIRGRPVIVGADPRGRGVVSAASYEARRFGVHSAMPISRAFRLCPEGVYLRVDMDKYAAVSREIMSLLADFTPLVEPLSIDEAFLDVTASRALHGEGPAIARQIKDGIKARVDLTASVGVASNMFVAKIASDLEKPDGLVIVDPGREAEFLAPLPVSRLWGVGKVTGAGGHGYPDHRPARPHPRRAPRGALRPARSRAPGSRARPRRAARGTGRRPQVHGSGGDLRTRHSRRRAAPRHPPRAE